MDYIQIAIETTRDAVEAISYFLVEEMSGGVEICDPQDVVSQDRTQVIFDLIDESLLSEDMDTVVVKAYFSTEIDVEEKVEAIKGHLKHISEFLNVGTGKITLLDIPEEKWANEWKKYYKPVKLGDHIVIKPKWEDYEAATDDLIIEMDPGMAFGTGTHETTAMCAELVEKYMQPNQTIVDIGTGSGILGIIAAKMGAEHVIGVDIDPVAVRVAKENVAYNHVEDKMEVYAGNLIDVVKQKGNIVVSNIIADVIIMLAEQVNEVIEEDGLWIASGIIEMRKEDVLAALEKNHFEIVEIHQQREWLAIVSKRSK
ncbi:MAG: 50S ribosomal protein L11 methyltransferase [Niameybacter sp.]|uniref:50S ribosomal protein L11 methyltransferase n=1 Tax=Niameybacter sp. TaxID=2033640 RepID=UPI002FCC4C2E